MSTILTEGFVVSLSPCTEMLGLYQTATSSQYPPQSFVSNRNTKFSFRHHDVKTDPGPTHISSYSLLLFGAWYWPLLLVPRLTCVWLYLHGIVHLSGIRETDNLTSSFPFPSKSFHIFVVILYVSAITLQAVIKYVTPESVTSLGNCDT
jgi:hypothetical protein